ncbi:MAG: sulfite exporter TauE/SafE family protein [Pseudomonadota bacterium]
MFEPSQFALGTLAGSLVGVSLGLVGGGGSILAVPLMVFVVGVKDPHIAIGTSALAVAINALVGLLNYARAGSVKWRCGFMYGSAGIVGAFAGSTAGKVVDGQKLLFVFAIMMGVVALLMFRTRRAIGVAGAECNRETAPKVLGYGAGTGVVSGFFGIGGGFMIVPGLMASTGMPILNAIGTSLIAVTAFGVTTAVNYAWSDLINWNICVALVLGGAAGSFIGMKICHLLSGRSGRLQSVFSLIIFVVALCLLYKSASTILRA